MVYEVQQYIELVRSGTVPVCKDQVALCDYVENCFRSEGIYVDEKQLCQYLNLQKYFPFRLFPWEIFVFALHNCTYRANGRLRWPILFVLVGRGAGKNGYLAFEDFCMLTPINGVKEYDIDIFATAEDQAKTSFMDVHSALESNKAALKKYFRWNMERITNLATGSTLRFRTSNHKTKDGGRPGKVDFDEYHAYEDYRMEDVATTGLGKKRLPRKNIMTTDGYIRGGPLDDLKSQAEGILYRGMDDGGMLPFVCRLDSPEEVNRPELWAKANPSLSYLPDLQDEMLQEYATYCQRPSATASFVVKRMNIPPECMDEDVTEWKNILAANRPLPDLTGKKCIASIDYAKTNDFVSAGLLFFENGIYYWMTHTWVCKNSRDLPRIKAPLKEWEEQGLLTFVDAPEIPRELPVQWVAEQSEIYEVSNIGMDNFRITWVERTLKEAGFDTDKDGENNILLTKRITVMRWAPVIRSAFATQSIVWGENRLMNWYVNNTYVLTDDDGNMTFKKKEEKSRKTDGFFALVHAFCASAQLEEEESEVDLNGFSVAAF